MVKITNIYVSSIYIWIPYVLYKKSPLQNYVNTLHIISVVSLAPYLVGLVNTKETW